MHIIQLVPACHYEVNYDQVFSHFYCLKCLCLRRKLFVFGCGYFDRNCHFQFFFNWRKKILGDLKSFSIFEIINNNFLISFRRIICLSCITIVANWQIPNQSNELSLPQLSLLRLYLLEFFTWFISFIFYSKNKPNRQTQEN